MEFTADTITKLKELFKSPEPEVLQGDDLPSNGPNYEITSNREKLPITHDFQKTPKSIEEFEEQEAQEAEKLSQVCGGSANRKIPEYSMNYQQSVTAEDVFLQIGPKTPSTASCENLIVRVKLHGDKKENVELSVSTTSVKVDSPQYFLNLPLPHAINPDLSKANWDTSDQTLVLTLKLDREFDFINF